MDFIYSISDGNPELSAYINGSFVSYVMYGLMKHALFRLIIVFIIEMWKLFVLGFIAFLEVLWSAIRQFWLAILNLE